MNLILSIGVSIVNIALIAYTLFFIRLIRKRQTDKMLLAFLITGVILDLSSTICMIIGSSNGPLTLHGIIGYVALLGMCIDTFIIARFVRKSGQGVTLTTNIFRVSVVFYIYWIIAYITGAILVML
jgi:hypothetical protein